jgi:hypothetical protein
LRIVQILITLLIAVYALDGVKDTKSAPVFCLKERAICPKTSLNPIIVQDSLVRVCVPMVHKLATGFRLRADKKDGSSRRAMGYNGS